MTEIKMKGNPVHTSGTLPAVGSKVPEVKGLVKTDLAEATLSSYPGKRVLNIFPSLDTGVCATSVRTFAKQAAGRKDVKVLNISMDLPFAHKRFCAAVGIEGVENLSAFRSDLPDALGLRFSDGPLKGLCSRAVIVLDGDGKVLYTEQVPEVTTEPNYEAALKALG